MFKHRSYNLCIDSRDVQSQGLIALPCDETARTQQWKFIINWYLINPPSTTSYITMQDIFLSLLQTYGMSTLSQLADPHYTFLSFKSQSQTSKSHNDIVAWIFFSCIIHHWKHVKSLVPVSVLRTRHFSKEKYLLLFFSFLIVFILQGRLWLNFFFLI